MSAPHLIKPQPGSPCPCGEPITMPGSAADFPFDPRAKVFGSHGLELLRTIDDRELAQMSYELHWINLHNETCRVYRRKQRERMR